MDAAAQVKSFMTERCSEALMREQTFRGQTSYYIRPEWLLEVAQRLLDEPILDVQFLADITCIDWLGKETSHGGRFEVVYNFYSLTHHYRFFIRCMLPADKPEIASLTPLWNGANWLEREVFDLFGIVFVGHPDLTKILTPDELEGHPLRRDYPLTWEQPVFSWNKNQPPEVIR